MAENGDTAEPGSETRGPSLQQLLLAGIGWASESIETADAFADDLARRLGLDRDRVRTALQDTLASWRREAERLGARSDDVSGKALARIGLARSEALEDLELRVAQLEHRLALLERDADGGAATEIVTPAPPASEPMAPFEP